MSTAARIDTALIVLAVAVATFRAVERSTRVAVQYLVGRRNIAAGFDRELAMAAAARRGDLAGRTDPEPLDAARVAATRLYHRAVALTPARRVTTWRAEQLLDGLGGPVLVRRPLAGDDLAALTEAAVLVRALRRLAYRDAEAYGPLLRSLVDLLPGLLPVRALEQIPA